VTGAYRLRSIGMPNCARSTIGVDGLRYLLTLLAIGIVLTSCSEDRIAIEPGKMSDAARITLAPARFNQLAGWSDDTVSAAVPAFVKSCGRLPKQPDEAPLDPAARDAEFGRVRDWRPLCQLAASLPPDDDAATRQFFEKNFIPVQIGAKGQNNGLITGYWEVELNGSRKREGPFQIAVYRRPPDLVDGQPYLDRGTIEDGALAGRGLEVVWISSADDLLTLQTQGSGRVHLPDGGTVRVGYEASNNRKFVNVYQLMLDEGTIPKAQFSYKTVRIWMRDHPGDATTVRRRNPNYVFFQEIKGDGPIGYQGAVLTPERSLAVDHHFIPLGAPLWLEAQDKYRPLAVKRLVVAQDIGDAITGPLRGDFYWGSGRDAASRGSDFYADGRYWVLLPKTIASRLVAALN
jgi:membrane-bound lytic murein transglycosylase A